MKRLLVFSVIATLSASFTSSVAGPKEDVAAALKKLHDAGSYTWTTTWENSQFRPDPSIGKIDKAGNAMLTTSFRNNKFVSVFQGEKAAMQGPDGWRSLAELESDSEGPGRFSAMMLRNFTPAADDAETLLKKAQDLKAQDDGISGKLTEEGARQMASFRRRRGAGQGGGPEISNASGSVTFWLAEGTLKKFSYTVKATMSWNGNERDIDRTITVGLTNIGSTTVEIPAAAKAKL